MTRYSIEPKTRKYITEYGFLSFTRNVSNKYGKQLLNTAFKYLAHEAGEFLGNKSAGAVAKSNDDKIVKPNYVIHKNPKNVEEIIFPLEKREEILNQLRQLL